MAALPIEVLGVDWRSMLVLSASFRRSDLRLASKSA